MAERADDGNDTKVTQRTGAAIGGEMVDAQLALANDLFGHLMPGTGVSLPMAADARAWMENAGALQTMWFEFQRDHAMEAAGNAMTSAMAGDPSQWFALVEGWTRNLPFANPARQQRLWTQSVEMWEAILGVGDRSGEGAGDDGAQSLPRSDKRFADPRWKSHPAFALIHQTYLLYVEQIEAMIDALDTIQPEKREQLRFAARTMVEALSPANFAATNPIVLEKTLASRGENLVKGMRNLLADLDKGQLTHTDPTAFTLGENIATTPGKVIHETRLYQVIQYSPSTQDVFEIPLVIFPPWINRFYILDLNAKKSFIRWAVEQGLTVFIVSWKSADASLADVTWDDYIAAQIDTIDLVRDRLDVPSVHAIGYCVAGTTLAATLAIMARRGTADRVKSATFFTAQVDFEDAGELLHFVDDAQFAAIENLATDGFLDGRYLAATFNMLRGNDLIWNYVVNNYLLGEEYPAFDLLHWNGDVTNLPADWHLSYLRDLYRDNKLVEPDRMEAGGTKINLRKVETPSYVQAGREDHIAPVGSVWKITDQFAGPIRFVLAGSGHIAGVVNPPAANKYQYWTNEAEVSTLAEFIDGATEHAGSWWPDWITWIAVQDDAKVPATGLRDPGSLKTDTVIENAPGRYVKAR